MKDEIQVLLSTFNGEKYVKEQIDSILAQREVNVSVLIRDDGSNDNTCQIIESYSSNRITLIKGENIGVTESFLELIRLADKYKYYSFADQDDVWDDNKLISGIQLIREYHDRPTVYSSSTRLVNSKLELIAIKVSKPKISLGSALIANYVAGCTTVFNEELMQLLKQYRPKGIPFHDWWINLVALSVEGVSIYDTVPHISYRQHSNNIVGASISPITKWRLRFYKFIKRSYHRDIMARQILELYGAIMPKKNKIILENIANYKIGKIKVIFDKNLRTNKKIDNILFWICIFSNRA